MDHFVIPFMDQILDRLATSCWYCFLDGYSSYIKISIAPKNHEKITFTYPYGTLTVKHMPFKLCNVPTTFQKVYDAHRF